MKKLVYFEKKRKIEIFLFLTKYTKILEILAYVKKIPEHFFWQLNSITQNK